MSEIKPNADGTCSRECPQLVSDGHPFGCRQTGRATAPGYEICPIAYQQLLEAARTRAVLYELRHRMKNYDEGPTIQEYEDAVIAASSAYDAVRDLVEVSDE